MTLLVVPDIHGNLPELQRVLALADVRYGADARIVFLGDLVDRGLDSRGVVETLLQGMKHGRDWIVLRGNHDQMFVDFLDKAEGCADAPLEDERWLMDAIGGWETLRSYDVTEMAIRGQWNEVAEAVPDTHRDFLANLPYYHETEQLIFVHAGIATGVSMADQSPEDLIWIREPFLSDKTDHGKLIIHGHTVRETPEHHGNRVNLDAGAAYGRPLQLARLDERDVFLVTNSGETQLTP